MRILLVTPGLYPRVRGGVEKQAYHLADALSRTHDILVFVTLPTAFDPHAPDRSYAIESFPEHVADGLGVNWAFEASVRRFRPDVILFIHIIGLNTVGLMTTLRRLRVPYVVTIHDYWYLCRSIHLSGPEGAPCRSLVRCPGCRVIARQQLLTRLPRTLRAVAFSSVANHLSGTLSALSMPFWFFLFRRFLLRRFLNHAAALTMNSYRVEATYREYRTRTDTSIVHYPGIPNPGPADLARLAGRQVAPPLPPPNRGLLFMGRVSEEKGASVLIAALGMLHRVKTGTLTIAGVCVGDMARRLRDQAAGLSGWRVVFSGPYKAPDLPDVLSRGDIVVIPSIWEEPYAMTVEEARQNGKVVVASDAGGISERIHHGIDGFLFRRGDAGVLARVLDEVLTLPPSKLADIAARAASLVTGVDAQARRLEDLLAMAAAGDRYASIRQRFGSVLPAIGSATGQPETAVLERLSKELQQPGRAVQEAWNAANPVTQEEIERFYATTDAYIYDLLVAHETWERKIWTKRAIELFAAAGVRSILDYGGGCGDDSLEFVKYADRVVLMEPGEKTAALAARRLADSNTRVVRSVEALGAERFDGIYCTEVLEHVPDPIGLMRTLSNRLRDGGIIIVTHSFGLISKDFPSHLPTNRGREQTFRSDVRTVGLEVAAEALVPGNRFFVLRLARA